MELRAPRTKRFASLLIIGLGVFLILGSIGYRRYTRVLSQPAAAPLPGQLANIPLTRKETGQAAVDEINRLHRSKFPLTSGAVGFYGPENNATLWVSGAPAKFIASRILTEMRDTIAESRSPFIPTDEFVESTRTIYQLEGMGQQHFYFQSNELLIWLAVDEAVAEEALENSLAFYR